MSLDRSAKKRIFISFDYDNDRHYRYLLSAFKENSSSAIDFIDVTPGEINTSDVGRVRAALTTEIQSATHTLVIVGSDANHYHRDRLLIGQRSWQWWEIEKSKELGKSLIAFKIRPTNLLPEPMLGTGAPRANSLTVTSILNAINGT